MLPDLPHLSHYFDLAEFLLFRLALLALFTLGLYRLLRGDWRKPGAPSFQSCFL